MKYLTINLIFSTLLLQACTKSSLCESKLIENCVTTQEFDPVCGCDGKTYSNPGHARCHGIDDFTKGKCVNDILGNWQLLGFIEDGAKLGIDKITYGGDVISLIIKEDLDNDLLSPFEGSAQPNTYNGKYKVGNEFIPTGDFITTKIGGTDYETKYYNNLKNVIGSEIHGNFLLLTSKDNEKFNMVFKKVD